MTLVTVLTPFSDAKSLPKVERFAGSDSQIAHIEVIFPTGKATKSPLERSRDLRIGAVRGQGHALVVRRGPQSNETIRIAPKSPDTFLIIWALTRFW